MFRATAHPERSDIQDSANKGLSMVMPADRYLFLCEAIDDLLAEGDKKAKKEFT